LKQAFALTAIKHDSLLVCFASQHEKENHEQHPVCLEINAIIPGEVGKDPCSRPWQ
jgi:hypothetical protein